MHFPSPDGRIPSKKLSVELRELAAEFRERPVTLREVLVALGARASGLLCIILALPFCAPISVPGLSTPFGAVIALIAFRFALGLPPWLPARLLDMKLPPRFFRAVLDGAGKFVGWVERQVRPRWEWMTATRGRQRMHALVVCFGALLLLLPLGGIPFTNMLPALVVVFATLGMMERDGIAISAAYGLLAATLIYFSTFAVVGIQLLDRFKHWLTS